MCELISAQTSNCFGVCVHADIPRAQCNSPSAERSRTSLVSRCGSAISRPHAQCWQQEGRLQLGFSRLRAWPGLAFPSAPPTVTTEARTPLLVQDEDRYWTCSQPFIPTQQPLGHVPEPGASCVFMPGSRSCRACLLIPGLLLIKVRMSLFSHTLHPPPPCPRSVSCPQPGFVSLLADSPSAPVNVTVKHLKANSAVVTWDVLEDEVVIGFAISQQKKDVRMLRFIQEVNTTTRSCALWDLEEDTEYIVHVQAISIQGQSPASEPVLFKTPREAEKLASKNKDEVTMKEMAKKNQQLRAGEILIIVVVLFMWAGVIALFCRQYDIIKDNEPNNSKEKAKSASENSTPEHQGGGLLRSKFPKNKPSVNIIEA
ncbi:fibronectin type III domain-containing protein 5 isoform X2 [Numida meleagris]|nr:fibronectin type III domain-containing protein 5 isoform X2 [Numida meleagris]